MAKKPGGVAGAASPAARDRLRVAVQTRMTKLGIDQAELIRRTGLSGPTIRKVIRAEGGYDDRTKFAVCDALGWTRDSIDLLLAGRRPRELDAPPPPPRAVGENGGATAATSEYGDLRRLVVRSGTVAAENTERLEEVLRVVGEIRGELASLRHELEQAGELRSVAEAVFDVAP